MANDRDTGDEDDVRRAGREMMFRLGDAIVSTVSDETGAPAAHVRSVLGGLFDWTRRVAARRQAGQGDES